MKDFLSYAYADFYNNAPFIAQHLELMFVAVLTIVN